MTSNLSALISARGGKFLGATPDVSRERPCVEFLIVDQDGTSKRVEVDALALMELMTVLRAFYQAVNVESHTHG
jgi:hypothetical protein